MLILVVLLSVSNDWLGRKKNTKKIHKVSHIYKFLKIIVVSFLKNFLNEYMKPEWQKLTFVKASLESILRAFRVTNLESFVYTDAVYKISKNIDDAICI